ISYDLIASIGKNHIEAEEAIHESEKCLAHNSSFSPLYSAK
ncbi:19196_t:CDS:1, partial [Racocetra persica]